jgi:hypothetical protein
VLLLVKNQALLMKCLLIKIRFKKEENMKQLTFLFFLITFFGSITVLAQAKTDEDMNLAFQNAKKGIYWALSNIPGKKATIENDLIAEDKLYASVKLSKEVNGVKVSSKGYYQTNEVQITIYKSYESLKSEGYNVPSAEW